MTELIEKWREFLSWWEDSGYKIKYGAETYPTKPTFYSFMQWLSDNKEK